MPSNAVLERLDTERAQLHANIDSVLGTAQEEERDLSEAERELIQRHRARLGEIEPQIGELLDLEEQRNASRDAHAVLARGRPDPVMVRPTAPAPTTEVVYRTFAEWARDELIVRFDAIARRSGPSGRDGAQERLTRAVANTLTSDVPGLLPPQHISEIMQVISAVRPIVESSRRVTLTNGKLNYPRITGRPSVSKQATEKTETTSTKMVVAMIDILADTYLGAGDLSWQTINWTTPDALQLWFQLAAEAYAIQTEGAAAAKVTGTPTPPVAVGGTPGSPTLADIYKALATAAGTVFSGTKRGANVVYAAINVAFALAGAVSNTAPVFAPGGSLDLSTGQGNIGGLRLVASRGMPAGSAVVADSTALLTAETAGAPVELRAVEPSIGGMEVGVIGAFVAERVEDGAFVPITGMPTALEAVAPPGGASGGETTSTGGGGKK